MTAGDPVLGVADTKRVSPEMGFPCPSINPMSGEPCVVRCPREGVPHKENHFNGRMESGLGWFWTDEWAQEELRTQVSRLESTVSSQREEIERLRGGAEGPFPNCKDCGERMIWSRSNGLASWMCPRCVHYRMSKAEAELSRRASLSDTSEETKP